jgi:uncharacterized membrane protein
MSSVIEPVEAASGAGWRRGLLLLGALAAYQLLLHWAVSSDPASGLGEFLTIAPLLAGLVWYLGRSWRGRIGLGVLALAAVAGWIAWRSAGADPALVYLVPHAGAYLFMFWLFGHTLFNGGDALITRLARLIHGTLPAEIESYTRNVTRAWCLFFAAMAATSLLLFLLAPLAVWSVFANLLNLPLIVAMFLAEYLYRIRRYPNFSHASIRATIRAFKEYGGSDAGVRR